jgi:hypothetical protein
LKIDRHPRKVVENHCKLFLEECDVSARIPNLDQQDALDRTLNGRQWNRHVTRLECSEKPLRKVERWTARHRRFSHPYDNRERRGRARHAHPKTHALLCREATNIRSKPVLSHISIVALVMALPFCPKPTLKHHIHRRSCVCKDNRLRERRPEQVTFLE